MTEESEETTEQKDSSIKISLTVVDRQNLAGVLPAKGNYTTNLSVEEINKKISINAQEWNSVFSVVTINTEEGKKSKTKINQKVNEESEKEFSFSTVEKEIVAKELRTLDDKAELPSYLNRLYELFVK